MQHRKLLGKREAQFYVEIKLVLSYRDVRGRRTPPHQVTKGYCESFIFLLSEPINDNVF